MNASIPRRFYVHRVDAHLSFRGREFGRVGTSLDRRFPVTIVAEGSDEVVVRQRKPHCSAVEERWFLRRS